MSDSVGKISLDLEVKSDLNGQITAVSKAIGKSLQTSLKATTSTAFKDMSANMNRGLKAMTGGMKTSLSKMKDSIKKGVSEALASAKNIKMPTPNFQRSVESMPAPVSVGQPAQVRGPPLDTEQSRVALQSLEATLENTNAKIEQQQAKLRGLKEALDNCFNTERKNKIQEQILKTEESIISLTAKSDKLGFKLADLDNAPLNNLGNGGANNINRVGKSAQRATKNINKATGSVKKLSSAAKSTNNPLKSFADGINKTIKRIVVWRLIMPMIVRQIKKMIGSLVESLKTNQHFASSLAQIQSNLRVAFMPIYEAILPAINALMAGLAKATAYVASFISAVFGKTFNQSKQATQGLINAKEAMGAYGDSAKAAGKKAKDALGLAGIDEINTLGSNDADDGDSEGSNVPTLVQPELDMSKVDSEMGQLFNKVRNVFKQILKPFSDAWDKEGVATIESIKYAFLSILDLIGSIGNSLLTVWSNGTGAIMVGTILQILQTIFGIIGDIASTFTTAWDNGNIGTEIIQGIANTINNLLTLIRDIGETLREAWGVVGEDVANTFMGVINSTVGVLENLSEKLIYVWENGGSHLFNGLIELGAKVFELAGYIYTEFIAPLINWLVDLLAPAFAPVLDAAGGLLDGITNLIDWLLNDGKPVLDIIIILLGSFAAAWGLVTLATGAWNVICGIATVVTTAFGAAVTFLTSPIGLVILAIAAIIAIVVLLIKNWDKVKEVAANVWNGIVAVWNAVATWFNAKVIQPLVNHFTWLWDSIVKIFTGAKDWFSSKFTEAWEAIKNVFSTVGSFFGGIWDTIKEKFTNIGSAIGNAIGDAFKFVVNSIINFAEKSINGFIKAINVAIKLINNIPGVNLSTLSPLQVPRLAKGGILNEPTLAMVGEAGKEAVVPLENNTQGLDLLANKLLERMPSSRGSEDSYSGDLILMIDGSVIGKVALAQLRKMQRQGGITLIPT